MTIFLLVVVGLLLITTIIVLTRCDHSWEFLREVKETYTWRSDVGITYQDTYRVYECKKCKKIKRHLIS